MNYAEIDLVIKAPNTVNQLYRPMAETSWDATLSRFMKSDERRFHRGRGGAYQPVWLVFDRGPDSFVVRGDLLQRDQFDQWSEDCPPHLAHTFLIRNHRIVGHVPEKDKVPDDILAALHVPMKPLRYSMAQFGMGSPSTRRMATGRHLMFAYRQAALDYARCLRSDPALMRFRRETRRLRKEFIAAINEHHPLRTDFYGLSRLHRRMLAQIGLNFEARSHGMADEAITSVMETLVNRIDQELDLIAFGKRSLRRGC